jgi:hypothetical protein
MDDFLYLVVTIVFFALMLVYVAGCERLGRNAPGDVLQPGSKEQ